jgi:hypothetical protein
MEAENYRVIHAWGKEWDETGLKTVSFEQLLNGTMGYGASIRYSLLPPDLPEGSPKYYYSESDLINDYGSWYAYFVEVRAQAGLSGGQVLRPVEFKAAGITIEVPDYDTFTNRNTATRRVSAILHLLQVRLAYQSWPHTTSTLQ